MGKKWSYVPSQEQLLDTRVARSLGDFSEDTFDTISTTYYTVRFRYAGHKIKYRVVEDDSGGERLRRKPKKPKGLQVEDIHFLDNQARMAIRAYREGVLASKERREEEAEFQRKCDKAEFLNELAQEKEIGTGTDRCEKLRQTSFLSNTEEEDESTAES